MRIRHHKRAAAAVLTAALVASAGFAAGCPGRHHRSRRTASPTSSPALADTRLDRPVRLPQGRPPARHHRLGRPRQAVEVDGRLRRRAPPPPRASRTGTAPRPRRACRSSFDYDRPRATRDDHDTRRRPEARDRRLVAERGCRSRRHRHARPRPAPPGSRSVVSTTAAVEGACADAAVPAYGSARRLGQSLGDGMLRSQPIGDDPSSSPTRTRPPRRRTVRPRPATCQEHDGQQDRSVADCTTAVDPGRPAGGQPHQPRDRRDPRSTTNAGRPGTPATTRTPPPSRAPGTRLKNNEPATDDQGDEPPD